MKNISFIITLLLMLGFSSCKESSMDIYTMKSDVFFHYSLTAGPWDAGERTPGGVKDSTVIRFGYDEIIKQDSIIAIKLRLIGAYADFDRPINFVLADNHPRDSHYLQAKEGEDIELLHDRSFMLANTRMGFIFVKLKNTDKLKDSEMLATLRTAPNEYFIAEYDSIQEGEKYRVNDRMKSNTYRIIYNSQKDKPNLWAAKEEEFSKHGFREYSNVKLDFMMQELNFDYEYFTYDPSTQDPTTVFNDRFPVAMISGWIFMLEIALERYENEHGEPLKDENGNNVIIGNYKPSGK